MIMWRTRTRSGNVAGRNGGDPPKKQGKQPATSSCRKHMVASNTSSVDDGVCVSGIAAVTAAAATMAVDQLILL